MQHGNNEKMQLFLFQHAHRLSVPIENEIEYTDINDVFNHIISEDDEKSDSGYDHGLTDY
jgi:hypothetical protein